MKDTIKLVQLNNKSRKGTYIYIRKDGKSAYYKHDSRNVDEDYINLFNERYIKGNKKAKLPSKKKTNINYYIKKTKQAPQIDRVINRGVFNVVSNNIRTEAIHIKEKELLSQSVKDEGILKILLEDENIKKLQYRFESKIELIGSNNTLLATGSVIGLTPRKLKHILTSEIIDNEYVDAEDYFDKLKEKLSKKGIEMQTLKSGNIQRIKTTFIFRKG